MYQKYFYIRPKFSHMANPVQESLKVLTEANQKIQKLLTGTEHVHQLLEINTLFRRIHTRLVFMGAVTEPEHKSQNGATMEFKPITNFMGEEIRPAKKVTQSDINPDEARRQQFLSKVDKLYSEFLTLTPAIVLNAYTIPEDVLVVRGVAKRAGVRDFQEKKMSVAFMEEIAQAINAKAATAALTDNIDKTLKKGDNKPVIKTFTQDEISSNPKLQELGAKPTDEILVFPDGKMTIKKPKP